MTTSLKDTEIIQHVWAAMSQDPSDMGHLDTTADLAGSCILLTGAAGYLGQYLLEALGQLPGQPALVIALDVDAVPKPVGQSDATLEVLWIKGSAEDQLLLAQLFDAHPIDIVVHAAAHKYLPELQNSPAQALAQNTWISYKLIEFCQSRAVGRFVYVSTDKATHPSSVYGCSKLWPEHHMAYVAKSRHTTNFAVLRLGNLLGSTGSVLPQWRRALEHGQRISIRSKTLTRFFVRPQSAAAAIITVLAATHKNKRWGLDMGAPWSIQKLAEEWLKIMGFDAPKNLIQHDRLLEGEKTAEQVWEDQDHPIRYGRSPLACVDLKLTGDAAHEAAIKALNALFKDPKQHPDDRSALKWFAAHVDSDC